MLHAVPAAVSRTLVLCCRFLAGQPGRCGKGGQAPLVCRSGLLASHGRCQLRHTGEQAGLNLLLNVDVNSNFAGQHSLQYMPCTGVKLPHLCTPTVIKQSSLSCRNIGIMAHIDAGKVRTGSCALFCGCHCSGQAFGRLLACSRVQAALSCHLLSMPCAKKQGGTAAAGTPAAHAAYAVPPSCGQTVSQLKDCCQHPVPDAGSLTQLQ